MAHPVITPVILTGGSGTRLWPLSRKVRPKQFLALTGEQTMLAETIGRTVGERFAPPILVGGAGQADILTEATPEGARVILEPMAKNTAPAIALAALMLREDAPMLVMPSDHVVADVAAFIAAVEIAAALAAEGWLVTFGIAPTKPEIGYGYIKQGDALAEGGHAVERFVEKPDGETARAYLEEGGYHWNGGIFMFTAGAFLAALETHAPAMAAAARQASDKGKTDGAVLRPDADSFAASPSESVDYAVMEKADRVAVVPVSMGWSDVGSWDALYEIAARDEAGNCVAGPTFAIDTENCLVRSTGPRVATIGVSDLLVIATGDAVLVMPRGSSQRVKEAVERLNEEGSDLL